MTRLTTNSKALLVVMLSRLLFGGYLAAKDQFAYDDAESALTVLIIYVLLGVFTALFLFGSRYGLPGVTGLTVVLIVLHTVFIVLAAAGTADAGLHDPAANLWATLLRYLLSLLTLVFAIRIYREPRPLLNTD